MMKYRPEIDGLRAIAVLAVVLYHAEFVFKGLNPFKGGFIGVDVFFVISGYLITSIILRDMQDGQFSFAHFYERRARRILPALFTIMAAAIPLAWMYMLPKSIKEYAGSVLAALAFGSNIWFWQEDSYWAEASSLKPFLHTWTLSVEEQFYVLFPIMLLWLWKFSRSYLTGFFIIGFLFSLGLAQFGSGKYVDATFYLLPTRGWELLSGAILAKLEIDYGRRTHRFLDMIMPALGIFFIVNAVVLLDDQMPHPSLITLLPVGGAMMLIWFGKRGELVSDLLSTKLFVGIGLISYSLYLWHFLIFAFARIGDGSPSGYDKVEHIALSFALAGLTYFSIEKPLRKPACVTSRKFLVGIALCGMVLTVTYMTLWRNPEVISYQPFPYNETESRTIGFDKHVEMKKMPKGNGTRSILIIGDSMADDLMSAFTMVLQSPDHLVFRDIDDGCLKYFLDKQAFIEKENYYVKNFGCNTEFLDHNNPFEVFPFVDYVIVTNYWNDETIRDFETYANAILKYKNIQKLIVVNRNSLRFTNKVHILINQWLKEHKTSLNPSFVEPLATYIWEHRLKAYDHIGKLLTLDDERVVVLDALKLHCGDRHAACPIFDENSELLFSDDAHWSTSGMQYFGKLFMKEFEEMINTWADAYHVIQPIERRPEDLHLHYEELVFDFYGSVARLNAFLGVDLAYENILVSDAS